LLLACGEKKAGLPEPSPTSETASAAAQFPPAASGATLWRWVNVTLVVPDNGRFEVERDSDPPEARPPDGGPVLKLYKTSGDGPSAIPTSWILLDARTGAVIRQNVGEADRAEIDAVLGTLSVAPLDVSTARWPYSTELPTNVTRETFGGGMSFIRPAPDTGMLVGGSIGDPGGPGLSISNGISGLGVGIDPATGTLILDTQFLQPEHAPVFMRWADSVKLCGSEICP
jgi:hypothetical protein